MLESRKKTNNQYDVDEENEFEWDEYKTPLVDAFYQRRTDGSDGTEEFASFSGGNNDLPPPPGAGGSNGIVLKNGRRGNYSDEEEEEEEDDNNFQQTSTGGGDPPTGGAGGGTLDTNFEAVAEVLRFLDGEGYDNLQISDFMENMKSSSTEFNNWPLDSRISEISKTLEKIDSLSGIDPVNSRYTADQKIEMYEDVRERKVTSKPFNLLSTSFGINKSLNNLTRLSEKITAKQSEQT